MFNSIFSRRALPVEVEKSPRPTSDSLSPARGGRRAAFTLIELLVVITIMATLLALLGGGIRRSIESARKRRAATEREAVRTAILNFWHDEGKPPIETKKGFHTYIYGVKEAKDPEKGIMNHQDWSKPLEPLLNPEHKLNNLKKAYLSEKDLNQKETDPTKRSIKKITINLSSKNATVE